MKNDGLQPDLVAYNALIGAGMNSNKPLEVYELWEDEASLAAHFHHENYFNMRNLLGSIGLAGADNNKFRCDLKEPVYDSTMTPRADFFTAG